MSIWIPPDSDFALALREPNLLIPGVYGKPVNQVRINHNNHFSYGLFSAHYVWNCLTNLSDNSVIPIGGSASIASSIVGMSVLSNGSSPMYAGALYPDSTNFTALTVYLPVASSSSNHVMWYDCNTIYSPDSAYNGFGGGSIREIHFGISNTNEWNFTGQLLNNTGGCSATLSKTIDVGKPYVLVGVSDAYQAKLWVDGVKGNDAAIQSAGVANSVTRLVNRVADSGRSDRYMRGYSPIFLCWNRVLSDSEIIEITRNPYQVFKPANDTPYLFPVAGGGGVSAELTGNSSTAAVGTLGVATEGSVSVTPSGVSATSAVGTLGATAEINASAELTGVSSSSAVGTITAEVGGGTTANLSGNESATSVGTLGVSTEVNAFADLLGNSATGAVGTLIVVTGLQVALSGNATTGAVGTLGVTAEVNASATLTGVGSSGAVGTLEITVPITVSVELTGVGATGTIGTLTAVGAGQVWTEIPPVSTIWTEIS